MFAAPTILPALPSIQAGVYRRMAAFFADCLIILIPFIAMAVAEDSLRLSASQGNWLFLAFFLIFGWLYWAVMESSPWQATFGKRLMGIKVVGLKGQRIGFIRTSWRCLARYVSFLVPFFLAFFMADFSSRKQSLHDMMAGVFVVFDGVRPGQPVPTKRPAMPWFGWALNFSPLLALPVMLVIALSVKSLSESMGLDEIHKAGLSVFLIAGKTQGCQSGFRLPEHPWGEKLEVTKTREGDCTVTITFGSSKDIPGPARHERIRWTRAKSGNMTCTSSLSYLYRPSGCSSGD